MLTADAGTIETTTTTESTPTAPPGVADVINAARAELEAGTLTLPGQEPAPTQPEAPAAEADDLGLPEGYTLQDDGQIRGPDGKFYSAEQVADMVVSAEAPPQAEPTPEAIKVRLPARQPGSEDEEYEVTDPNLAERINQLRNGYIRGEDARRQIEEARTIKREADQLIASLRHDPVNTILSQVPENVRADLVRHLLADESVWSAVNDDLATWDSDEQERRAAWAELRANRYEQGQQARAQIAEYQAAQENAQQVTAAIEGLVPEGMDDARAQAFLRYAIRDLREYVNQNGINRLDPAEVPALLHRMGTLAPFGIQPYAPSAATNGGVPYPVAPQPTAAVTATAAPQPVAAPTVPAPQVSADAAAKYRAALARRRAAAAVAPVGAGATPIRMQPPPGQTVQERIDWARKHALG